ncbi:MAG TPA: RNA polymerase sigma-70 factor [Actinomycetes bacterium]
MDEHDAYARYRPLLFSIAYRMVGSVSEAEDIVQETFLRAHRAGPERVDSPKAYLAAITTRLAIDHLRSARVRREAYVGSWLPEPLVTDADDTTADPAAHAETADSLSLAFLVLLERLSPVERAVFLLREVFGYDYDEIARVVGKREDNARQIAVRARRHVEAGRPRFETSRRQREELSRRFLAAVEEGDTDGLVGMLAADAVMYGDGGGKAPAVSQPIHGAVQVARFLLGLARLAERGGVRMRPAEVNGQPGAIAYDPEGNLISVLALDIADGLVQTVHSIVNPDKLRHLGPVTDWSWFGGGRGGDAS